MRREGSAGWAIQSYRSRPSNVNKRDSGEDNVTIKSIAGAGESANDVWIGHRTTHTIKYSQRLSRLQLLEASETSYSSHGLASWIVGLWKNQIGSSADKLLSILKYSCHSLTTNQMCESARPSHNLCHKNAWSQGCTYNPIWECSSSTWNGIGCLQKIPYGFEIFPDANQKSECPYVIKWLDLWMVKHTLMQCVCRCLSHRHTFPLSIDMSFPPSNNFLSPHTE